MTPLTFITGVLLGTAASIAFGLAVVMLLFLVLGAEQPRLEAEWPGLLRSLLVFLVMTAICAVSFISLLRNKPWRWLAQVLMWAGVALVVAWYVME